MNFTRLLLFSCHTFDVMDVIYVHSLGRTEWTILPEKSETTKNEQQYKSSNNNSTEKNYSYKSSDTKTMPTCKCVTRAIVLIVRYFVCVEKIHFFVHICTHTTTYTYAHILMHLYLYEYYMYTHTCAPVSLCLHDRLINEHRQSGSMAQVKSDKIRPFFWKLIEKYRQTAGGAGRGW